MLDRYSSASRSFFVAGAPVLDPPLGKRYIAGCMLGSKRRAFLWPTFVKRFTMFGPKVPNPPEKPAVRPMQSVMLPLFLLVLAATALSAGLVTAGKLIGPRREGAVKRMPYESGMNPIHDAHRRFDVRFHLVAIAFLVFDVELLFLYPWAVASRRLRPGEPAPGHRSRRADAPDRGPRDLVFAEIWSSSLLWRSGLCTPGERGVSMAVELPENVVVSRLDALASWCRKNSLWPMPFATACCGIELMATGASRHDLARFGAEVFRFSPRQCDLMIVAGRVVMKMLPVLQRIWQQMHEPKWCISMGACASTGGVFDTYAWCRGSIASFRSTCTCPAVRRGPSN